MAFPDFPFPEEAISFPHHSVVRQYLDDYAQHYNLTQYIKFLHSVEEVQPLPSITEDPRRKQLKVRARNVNSNKSEIVTADSVIVCNGHYTLPYTPDIPGLDEYRGEVIHSHNYR